MAQPRIAPFGPLRHRGCGLDRWSYPAGMDQAWTQQAELAFIEGSLGEGLSSSPKTFHPEYRVRVIRGYIASLDHRKVFWPGGWSVEELRAAARKRLSAVLLKNLQT